MEKFEKGDKIDIGTGYDCDRGTFLRYEGDLVVWESKMGGHLQNSSNL